MLGIFFVHLVDVATFLIRKRKTFQWFGPTSLVPNWKDLWDMIGMFKWFLGKGPRPAFDRWTYWEKFDYWAVFWGMAIIGGSGMMLAFPDVAAMFMPGWVFNVAMVVHGEEAFLAAVFLFTVHFFNNHFRPDKLPPPDIVMFYRHAVAGRVQARALGGIQPSARVGRTGEISGGYTLQAHDPGFQDPGAAPGVRLGGSGGAGPSLVKLSGSIIRGLVGVFFLVLSGRF